MSCRAPSFPKFSNLTISKIVTFPKIIYVEMLCYFLNYVEVIFVPKLKNRWCWESWTRPKILKSCKMKASGVSQSEIEKLPIRSDAE